MGPVHKSSVSIASVRSEDLGVFAHMRRHANAFATRVHKAWK